MGIRTQIESYERMLVNIEWHVETNSRFIDEKEMSYLQQKIRDYKDFIYTLTKLEKEQSVIQEPYQPYVEDDTSRDFEPRQKFKDW